MAHRDLEITAYHEAGHAVVALYSGWRVHAIEIAEEGGSVKHAGAPPIKCGHITCENWQLLWGLALRNTIAEAEIALAGPFAESKFLKKDLRALGKFDDFERVVEVLTRLEEVRQGIPALAEASLDHYKRGLFDRIALETAQLLGRRDVWRAVRALAKALLKQHRLSGLQVMEVLEHASSPPGQLRLPIQADAFPPI